MDIELAGYRIEAVLGHGGMATVYRAEQLKLGRLVALKVMAPELADDAEFRRHFLEESRLAADLAHPHVVPIFDAGDADGLLYIAMRYVQGSDLSALLRRGGPMPTADALELLSQIADALDTAHSQGLLHRDVTPGNVLIAEREDGRPRWSYLTDFGISRTATQTTTSGRGQLGSIHYMSPEHIRGEHEDPRSDVYSLACVLFCCLTGEPPFQRQSPAAVLYAHMEAPRPRASDLAPAVPAALDEVLAAGLAPDPAHRPGTCGELIALAEASLAARHARGAPRPGASEAGATRAPARAPGADPAPAGSAHTDPTPPPARRLAARVAGEETVVGRLREEAELMGALQRATAGSGGLVLLSGEAGIGKTSLARRIVAEAARRGIPAVWSSGAIGETPPPYWHWAQVVTALARRPERAELFGDLGGAGAWLAAVAPGLADEVPGLGEEIAGLGEERRESVHVEGRLYAYDALGMLLSRAARRVGLVVVLDDLHLADEASLLALAFVASAIQTSGVLLVGTYRDRGGSGTAARGLESTPLAEVAGSAARIALASLDVEHVARLIAARGGEDVSGSFAAQVHEITGGNPLFVTELLSLLASEGRLGGGEIALGDLTLSGGIRDAISRRLAPLPQGTREALSAAAVIGTSFRASTLTAATGAGRAVLLEDLDRAVDAGLIRPEAEASDVFAFSHGLVQATLYEALPRSARSRLHAAVGDALERQLDLAAGDGLAEVADHFLLAGDDPERALAYGFRAAAHASRTYAYEQAATLYSRTLEFAWATTPAGRIELLQALGEAQMRAGDPESARVTLARAAEAARAAGDGAALARAALASNVWGLTLGVDEQLVRIAEEAVQALQDGSSPGLLACVQGLLASSIYWSGQQERRELLAEEALDLARAHDEREQTDESARVLAYVIGRYLLGRWGPRSAVRDMAISEELVQRSLALHDGELEVLVRNWRITELLELGQFVAVDQEIARVAQMAGDLRQPRAMVFLPLLKGCRSGTIGRFGEVERLNAESHEIGLRLRGMNANVGELAATAQLLSVRLQQGRLPELEGTLRAFVTLHPGMVAMQSTLALLLAQAGKHAEARAELERITDAGLDRLPEDNTVIVGHAMLGEAAALLGDRARADTVFGRLEPFSGRWVVSAGAAALWPIDRSLARLATAAGRLDAAAAYLARAREQAERAGARPSIALADLDGARLLMASDSPDIERVRALARSARELAQELDMGLVVDEATLLEGAPADGA